MLGEERSLVAKVVRSCRGCLVVAILAGVAEVELKQGVTAAVELEPVIESPVQVEVVENWDLKSECQEVVSDVVVETVNSAVDSAELVGQEVKDNLQNAAQSLAVVDEVDVACVDVTLPVIKSRPAFDDMTMFRHVKVNDSTIYDVFTDMEIQYVCRMVETEDYQAEFISKVHGAEVAFARWRQMEDPNMVSVITHRGAFAYGRKNISDDTLLAVEYAWQYATEAENALFFRRGYADEWYGQPYLLTDPNGHVLYGPECDLVPISTAFTGGTGDESLQDLYEQEKESACAVASDVSQGELDLVEIPMTESVEEVDVTDAAMTDVESDNVENETQETLANEMEEQQ